MASPTTGAHLPAPGGLARIGFSPAPFIHAVAFVTGFSLVFTGLGALIGSLGTGTWRDWLEIGAGTVLIILGFHLSGVVRFGPITNILYRQRGIGIGAGDKPNLMR